jgi:hypothetical protein
MGVDLMMGLVGSGIFHFGDWVLGINLYDLAWNSYAAVLNEIA